jgi:hypothetical protein
MTCVLRRWFDLTRKSLLLSLDAGDLVEAELVDLRRGRDGGGSARARRLSMYDLSVDTKLLSCRTCHRR